MTESFDLSTYACASPPRHLWRVSYPSSVSEKDPTTGDITARDQKRRFLNKSNLTDAFAAHVNWSNRKPSCFISAFNDGEHTCAWASRRTRIQKEQVWIYHIDTEKLPQDVYVFNAQSLTEKLGVTYPYAAHEFLILYRIPGSAISEPIYLSAFDLHLDALKRSDRWHPDDSEESELREPRSSDEERKECDELDDLVGKIQDKLVISSESRPTELKVRTPQSGARL